MNNIDNIINKFIWNKKATSRATGLISKTQLKSSYEKGGLNAPDIYSMNLSLKYKNILRSTSTTHPIKAAYQSIFKEKNFNLEYNPFTCKKDMEKFEKTTKDYIDQAILTHRILDTETELDMFESINDNDDIKLHKNYYIKLQNIKLSQIVLRILICMYFYLEIVN